MERWSETFKSHSYLGVGGRVPRQAPVFAVADSCLERSATWHLSFQTVLKTLCITISPNPYGRHWFSNNFYSVAVGFDGLAELTLEGRGGLF